jgi:phosphoenolpyruvate carboxylase
LQIPATDQLTPTEKLIAPVPMEKKAHIPNRGGKPAIEAVETIRQTAVRFRCESDPHAGADLNKLLKKLTRGQTISVVRAFSYFSHLANSSA